MIIAVLTPLFLAVALAAQGSKRYRFLRTVLEWADRPLTWIRRFLQMRWLMLVTAVLAVGLFAAGYVNRTPDTVWNAWTTSAGVSLVVFVLLFDDWLLTTIEASLAKLVRNEGTRDYSQLVVVLAALFAGMTYSHILLLGWEMEIAASIVLFCAGVMVAARSIWATLRETSPTPTENLPDFVLVILKSFTHHFVTLGLLSWWFLAYFNSLLPRTFVGEGDKSAGVLLLGSYVVGKLTMAGTDAVAPGTKPGIALDTAFSVIGFGMAVVAVSCFFALLSRVKEPDTLIGAPKQPVRAGERKRR